MRWVDEIVAGAAPDATALIDHDGAAYSYADLHASCDTARRELERLGVVAGDRVMLVAENCAALAAIILAAAAMRIWLVPVNARLTERELQHISSHSGARVLVFTDAASPEAASHGRRFGAGPVAGFPGVSMASGPTPGPPEPLRSDPTGQIAALFYTSGTTGRPKGVMLSHASLVFNALTSRDMRGLSPSDRLLIILPCTHIMAFSTLLMAGLAAGSTMHMMPRFSPAAVLAAFGGGTTVFSAVPQLYDRLLHHLDDTGAPLVAPRLRQIGSGGAPLDAARKKRIEDRFGLPLNNGYGMTEAGPMITSTVFGPAGAAGAVGFAPPQIDMRLGEPNQDGIGEVQLRGPNLMTGYYRDREATAAAMTADGFLRTGDLGRFDADGALHIVGRAKSVIVRSGFNVYPEEVEAVLSEHPAVRLAAVIGHRTGADEEVVAFVTADGDIPVAELQLFVRERLVAYKRPQHIVFVDSMPLTSAGKPLKSELLTRFADRVEAVRCTTAPQA